MADEAVFARLSGYAGLAALVASRIHPRQLPQRPVYPALTYFEVSAPREHAMGRDPGIVRARYQISSWGLAFTDVRNVDQQVRQALNRYRGTLAGWEILDVFPDAPDEMPEEIVNGVLIAQITRDFEVIYREAA